MKNYERKVDYTKEDIIYIVYNNRSLKNVVSNFIPKYSAFEILHLQKVEKTVRLFQNMYNSQKEIEINLDDIDTNAVDYYVTPQDIKDRTQLIIDAHNNISEDDYQYLIGRGITDEMIKNGKFGSMSYIKDIDDLNILGCTTHPTMRKILHDGLEGGGIIMPIFDKDGNLINAAFRKRSDLNKFKYTHTVLDIFTWGLDDINVGDIVWVVEGTLDKYALDTLVPKDNKVVSISSASMSPIQFMSLINKRPKLINIICDNDQVGFRTGAITQKVFFSNNIHCETYYFPNSKDVCEHILEKKGNLNDLVKVRISKSMIESQSTEYYTHRLNMNFMDYLKNRTF